MSEKSINLALQGGGAHGAYTWGVLDALLADGRLRIDGISGTSAGAMNAVVLAAGYRENGTDGARQALADFWRAISREGQISGQRKTLIDAFMGVWSMPFAAFFPVADMMSRATSPYDVNPLNINPLKDLIAETVDFDAARACREIQLFIAATQVETGKIRIFRNADLTAEAVMASACLPFLFQAVEIDGRHYWDGGYSGNPALFPFFGGTGAEDILLVQINPIERDGAPRRADEIVERVNEITFNASLLRELRAIDFVNRMLDEGRLDPARYARNRVHRLDGHSAMADFGAGTRLDTSYRFFQTLKARGEEAARIWLDENYEFVGVRSTLELRETFI